MRCYSISAAIAGLTTRVSKLYIVTYDPSGFEAGFGRAGDYDAHAHSHLTDLLFAPDGVACDDVRGAHHTGSLLVIPPRTYYSPRIPHDFFFMKWAHVSPPLQLPDKIMTRVSEGNILSYNPASQLVLPWYVPSTAMVGAVTFALASSSLTVSLSCGDGSFRVTT